MGLAKIKQWKPVSMAWKQFFREEKESWAATQLLMVKFPGNVLFCKATTGDTLSSLWSVGLLGNTLILI